MFAFLYRLFASFGRLADSVEALADTTDAVNAGLRARLGLEPAEAPRVIEHRPDAEARGGGEAHPQRQAREGHGVGSSDAPHHPRPRQRNLTAAEVALAGPVR